MTLMLHLLYNDGKLCTLKMQLHSSLCVQCHKLSLPLFCSVLTNPVPFVVQSPGNLGNEKTESQSETRTSVLFEENVKMSNTTITKNPPSEKNRSQQYVMLPASYVQIWTVFFKNYIVYSIFQFFRSLTNTIFHKPQSNISQWRG